MAKLEERPGEDRTHLFGRRDENGAEVALCDVQGQPVLFIHQLDEAPGKFVSCQECIRQQNRLPGA